MISLVNQKNKLKYQITLYSDLKEGGKRVGRGLGSNPFECFYSHLWS